MRRIALLAVACTIADVLPTLRPGAEWALTGNAYEGINWIDKNQSIPTKGEVNSAIGQCNADRAQREGLKTAARSILKNGSATATEKVNSLIFLLDLDK